jgi:hypothetical protein
MIGSTTMPASPPINTTVQVDDGHDDRDDEELLLHRHGDRDLHLNCTTPLASPPLLPPVSSRKTRRRRLPSSWLVLLLAVPLCRSEAFAARSAFFGSRTRSIRGGASSETKSPSSSQQPPPPPLTCVMQAPPSAGSVNGYSTPPSPDDFHNQHQHHQLNSKKKLGKKLSLSKLPPPPPFATTTTSSSQPWRNTPSSKLQPLPKQSPVDYPLEFVAETRLPTKLGEFRLRAYRRGDTEPCVIYSAHHPLQNTANDNQAALPVRVHDQCMTSEVFGSQRYVMLDWFVVGFCLELRLNLYHVYISLLYFSFDNIQLRL